MKKYDTVNMSEQIHRHLAFVILGIVIIVLIVGLVLMFTTEKRNIQITGMKERTTGAQTVSAVNIFGGGCAFPAPDLAVCKAIGVVTERAKQPVWPKITPKDRPVQLRQMMGSEQGIQVTFVCNQWWLRDPGAPSSQANSLKEIIGKDCINP